MELLTALAALPSGTHRGPLVRSRVLRVVDLLTTADLRDRVVDAGAQVSEAHLRSIELGRRTLSDELHPALAAAYRLHPDDLIRVNPDPHSPIGGPLVPIRVLRRPSMRFPQGLHLEDLPGVIAEASRRLGKEIGVDASTLTNVELGRARASDTLRTALAMAYGVHPVWDVTQAPAPRRGRPKRATADAA